VGERRSVKGWREIKFSEQERDKRRREKIKRQKREKRWKQKIGNC
jgi:hypothetical protein